MQPGGATHPCGDFTARKEDKEDSSSTGSRRKGRGTRGRQKSSRYEQVAATPAVLASLLKHFPTQNQPSQSGRELPGFPSCSPGARTPRGPRRIRAAQSPATHTQSCNSCVQSGARNRLPPCPTAGWGPAGTALRSAGPAAAAVFSAICHQNKARDTAEAQRNEGSGGAS